MNHAGQRLLITGIPTVGKSYLAKKLADTVGGLAVSLDDLRESLSKDDKYGPWVNFYLSRDEEKYLTQTSPEEQWQNLVDQSEALWPVFINAIESYASETRPVIFECVNMLPHLADRDLGFPGLVLLGDSCEEAMVRNKKDPRWGNTEKLQELEVRCFWEVERPHYRGEGEKYNWPIFENAGKAFDWAIKLFNNN